MTDLRTIERNSIRAFVQSAADDGYLSGRVLDYGCGKQPYRDIVEATGGEYHGFDSPDFPANVSGDVIAEHFSTPSTGSRPYVAWQAMNFDAVLCTQVIQYLPDPRELLDYVEGTLVMTYPTNWPEVEPEDLHRFTKAGMERLLTEAGFEIVRHERRASAFWPDAVTSRGPHEEFALGYGVIARA